MSRLPGIASAQRSAPVSLRSPSRSVQPRVRQPSAAGRPPEKAGGTSCGEDLVWLGEAAERLRIAAEAPKPILMGRDLIALGYKPSPQFGKWLDACFEAQLDGAFADHAGALAWFKEKFVK